MMGVGLPRITAVRRSSGLIGVKHVQRCAREKRRTGPGLVENGDERRRRRGGMVVMGEEVCGRLKSGGGGAVAMEWWWALREFAPN
jgi:hypothetical protein